MVVNTTVNKLMNLGFSEYEARTYLVLLENYPATAYEIARRAGIPTSKIYQVIEKLLKRSLIQPFNGENKKLYIPLEPGEFIKSQKTHLETTLNSLKEELIHIKPEGGISFIWNLTHYQAFIEKAGQLIEEAKHTLLISLWKEELALLADPLQAAEARGVQLALVHFGPPEKEVGMLFHHPIEKTIYAEKGGRGLVLVKDAAEALIATIFESDKVEGAWSINQGFVTTAEDYIKHDIYITKIIERFDRELIHCFGKNYYKLRDIFTDEEEHHENLH